jgi:hypothetical protein
MAAAQAHPGRFLQAVRIQARPGGAGVQAGDGERHPPVVWRTVNDERLSKRFLQAAAESGLMGSSAGDARHGHGLAYPRLRCGPLTAILLAYNRFGDSLFEASCRLGGETAGRCL